MAQAGDGRDALRLLPDNTAMVMTINVERTKSSATGKSFLDAFLESREATRFTGDFSAKAGLDVRRDIKTIVVGMADDFDTSEDMVMVLEGRFDKSKIVALAEKESSSFATRKHRGVTFYELDGETAFGFVGRYAIAAPIRTMPKIIDVHTRKASSSIKNRPLMGLIKAGDTKKDMWVVFVIPRKLRGEISKETGGHSVEAFMTSMDLKRGMSLQMRLDVSTREGASAIATLMRKTAQDAAKDPNMAALGVAEALRKTAIRQRGKRIDLGFQLSKGELAKVIGAVRAMRGPGPGGGSAGAPR